MNERSLKIIELLSEQGTIEVTRLAQELDVSAVTIRKDLDDLEKQGLLTRQHGCAVRVSPNDIRYRMASDYEIKRRIARGAAAMVKSGEVVMIESGSTCAMLAQELVETKRDVIILTNSAFIASIVRRIPGARVTLFGGSYDNDAQVVTGPLVKMCAREFSVEKFFLGTDGYDLSQGFSNVDLQRAEAVRAMAESAERRIVLTDSSKFNRKGVVSLMRAEEVSTVVTDAVPDNCRSDLEARGVQIVLV
ncbi:MAG: DeoR/GlpR family DNA-binding transcription regulator [Oscillospiraceae bacterium]|nr:DeoR/GlpR family DNA-binding transcription regulator [Oscillospiraceae bacterium]